MAATKQTTKFLWAKSGNMCAICRTALVIQREGKKNIAIGQECHIIGQRLRGPRGHEAPPGGIDDYSNLILLCANHHSEVDRDPITYTSDALRKIKDGHEEYVGLLGKVKDQTRSVDLRYTESPAERLAREVDRGRWRAKARDFLNSGSLWFIVAAIFGMLVSSAFAGSAVEVFGDGLGRKAYYLFFLVISVLAPWAILATTRPHADLLLNTVSKFSAPTETTRWLAKLVAALSLVFLISGFSSTPRIILSWGQSMILHIGFIAALNIGFLAGQLREHLTGEVDNQA